MSEVLLKNATNEEITTELDRRGYDVTITERYTTPDLPDGWGEICCKNCEHYIEDSHFCFHFCGGTTPVDDCDHFVANDGTDPDKEDVTVLFLSDGHIYRSKVWTDADMYDKENAKDILSVMKAFPGVCRMTDDRDEDLEWHIGDDGKLVFPEDPDEEEKEE